MELVELDIARDVHPVDVIEQVAHNNDWAFERTGDDEIAISVAGSWTDYHVSFSWMEDFEALHLACAFDIKVPESPDAGSPAAPVADQRAAAVRPFRSLGAGRRDHVPPVAAAGRRRRAVQPAGRGACCRSALEACEGYFQAFQFVVWSGTSARDALPAVLFETTGNA